MQRAFFAAALPALLVGCATTAADLGETKVKAVIESQKSTQAFATCAVENLVGNPQLRSDGDHYWIVQSVLDLPRIRWDFLPSPTGSRAELRSTVVGRFGEEKVRSCA